MAKPNTSASDAINIANQAIDRQAGGVGQQAKATRAELDASLQQSDAKADALKRKSSGTA